MASEIKTRAQRRQEPMKRRRIETSKASDASYMLKHFMALDRRQTAPQITREMLKIYYNLPLKKDPSEPGLFDKIVSKSNESKSVGVGVEITPEKVEVKTNN